MPKRSLWDCIQDASHTVLQSLEKSDLLALSLVNKSFHHECEPYLYASFESNVRWVARCLDTPRLVSFLRTTLKRPGLTEHMRDVRLCGDSRYATRKLLKEVDQTDLDLDLDLDLAYSAIDATNGRLPAHLRFATEWKDSLRRGSTDALITLIISQVPKLQRLTLGDLYTGHCHLLGKLIWATTFAASGLTYSLTTLNLLTVSDCFSVNPVDEEPQKGENTANVLPFFYLKTAENISAALSNPELFQWLGTNVPDLSNLTSLKLTVIRETHLPHILRLATNLEVFKFEWFYDVLAQHSTNQHIVQLDILSDSLELVRDTLQELSIRANDVGENREFGIAAIDFQGSLESLRTYPRLRTVSMPMQFLIGSWSPDLAVLDMGDVVPQQIRSLTIHDDLDGDWFPQHHEVEEWRDETLTMALLDWADTWVSTHPQLEVVKFFAQKKAVFESSLREQIFDAGRARGTRIQIQWFRPDYESFMYRFFDSTNSDNDSHWFNSDDEEEPRGLEEDDNAD